MIPDSLFGGEFMGLVSPLDSLLDSVLDTLPLDTVPLDTVPLESVLAKSENNSFVSVTEILLFVFIFFKVFMMFIPFSSLLE